MTFIRWWTPRNHRAALDGAGCAPSRCARSNRTLMSWTVFYAWQSDLPNNTNRGLIERALEDAVARLGADGAVVQDPRVDRDTLGVAGSPDIERTIFEKIEQAAVFVCDVSLVTRDIADRPCPNPNVLVELGFALQALGAERVIMVMNRAWGGPELLPFDIRRKRVLAYDAAPDDVDKPRERTALAARLVDAIGLSMRAAVANRASSSPGPADALMRAIEAGAPTRRACARAYAASVLKAVDARRPPRAESDEDVVAAIEALREDVVTFLKVAASVAAHDPEDVVEELLHFFEAILVRYDLPAGFSGSFRRTDFDYVKFIGHELFVGLVAAYIGEEQWDALDRLLRAPLLVTGGARDDRQVFYDRICQSTEILDVVRRDRISDGRSKRISVRADLLKERFESGALAELLPWSVFMQADLVLYLRTTLLPRTPGQLTGPSYWFPWSVLYLQDLPVVIRRAEGKRYAERLAVGLGTTVTPGFGEALKVAIARLAESYRSAWWHPPGDGYDWSRIAKL